MSSLLPIRPTVEDESEEAEILELGEADEVFDVLAAETTRAVLQAVYDEPRTPAELAETVDTSLQNVGYHLDKLEEADLVTVAETGYSEQGREQAVYAPTRDSLVVVAGDEETTSSLRDALARFLGAVGILGLLAVVFQWVARTLRTEQTSLEPTVGGNVPFDSSSGGGGGSLLDLALSPGVVFFAGGLVVLLGVALYWRYARG